VLQFSRLASQLFGRRQHLNGRAPRLAGSAIDAADGGADLLGAPCRSCVWRVISCVAAPRSSTALALVAEISLICSMMPQVPWIAVTAWPVTDWIDAI
jgi:hypothetical protein